MIMAIIFKGKGVCFSHSDSGSQGESEIVNEMKVNQAQKLFYQM